MGCQLNCSIRFGCSRERIKTKNDQIQYWSIVWRARTTIQEKMSDVHNIYSLIAVRLLFSWQSFFSGVGESPLRDGKGLMRKRNWTHIPLPYETVTQTTCHSFFFLRVTPRSDQGWFVAQQCYWKFHNVRPFLTVSIRMWFTIAARQKKHQPNIFSQCCSVFRDIEFLIETSSCIHCIEWKLIDKLFERKIIPGSNICVYSTHTLHGGIALANLAIECQMRVKMAPEKDAIWIFIVVCTSFGNSF